MCGVDGGRLLRNNAARGDPACLPLSLKGKKAKSGGYGGVNRRVRVKGSDMLLLDRERGELEDSTKRGNELYSGLS